jgi:GNAT superfamily N-acetyltransferase
MSAELEMTIRRLTPQLLDDYLAFFDGPAFADNPDWAPCYCYYPYAVEGGATDEAGDAFLARSAEANRQAITEAITCGRAEGYMAYVDGRVVGWVSAAPRERYPQWALLPGDSARTGVTPCFTIDPRWRRRGIARRLLTAAIDGLRADGMLRLEAGPYADPQDDAHRYRGTVELYGSAGYVRVADLPGGITLMRLDLESEP